MWTYSPTNRSFLPKINMIPAPAETSFVKPISYEAVTLHKDGSLFWERTEVRSKYANLHLGHVFDDGPKDRGGKRYCMNSAALRFISKEEMEKEGYEEYLKLFPEAQ